MDKRTVHRKTVKRTMDEIVAAGHEARSNAVRTRCTNDNRWATRASVDRDMPLCTGCQKKYNMEHPEDFVATERNVLRKATRRSYLPKNMVSFYEDAYLDEDLISLREDLATYEARIMSLTLQIRDDPRNSGPWASTLDKMMKQMKGAVRRGALTWANAFKQIEDFMQGPVSAKLIWAEVNIATDMKRKLAIAEAKRMHDIGWTPEAVMKGIEDIAAIVRNLQLSEDMVKFFMEQLAESPLFANPHLKLLNQLNISAGTTEEQLLAQEIVHTQNQNGVFVPELYMGPKIPKVVKKRKKYKKRVPKAVSDSLKPKTGDYEDLGEA